LHGFVVLVVAVSAGRDHEGRAAGAGAQAGGVDQREIAGGYGSEIAFAVFYVSGDISRRVIGGVIIEGVGVLVKSRAEISLPSPR